MKHINRDAVSTMCKISGPFQKNSTDWTVARKKFSFKKPLTEFCIKS